VSFFVFVFVFVFVGVAGALVVVFTGSVAAVVVVAGGVVVGSACGVGVPDDAAADGGFASSPRHTYRAVISEVTARMASSEGSSVAVAARLVRCAPLRTRGSGFMTNQTLALRDVYSQATGRTGALPCRAQPAQPFDQHGVTGE